MFHFKYFSLLEILATAILNSAQWTVGIDAAPISAVWIWDQRPPPPPQKKIVVFSIAAHHSNNEWQKEIPFSRMAFASFQGLVWNFVKTTRKRIRRNDECAISFCCSLLALFWQPLIAKAKPNSALFSHWIMRRRSLKIECKLLETDEVQTT